MTGGRDIGDTLTVTLAQIDPVVGDVDGNAARIRATRGRAAKAGADLVAFPELVLSGYPPEDLVLKEVFLDHIEATLNALAAETIDGGPALLVGAPWRENGNLHNAALLLDGGKIAACRLKHDLPNYGVFDEARVFVPGPLSGPANFRGVRIGMPICEDIWSTDVVDCLVESGAEILIVPNGSPFDHGKGEERLQHALARVCESGLPLAYVNQVGGQDELVFDGASFVVNADRSLAIQAPSWKEAEITTIWRRSTGTGNSGTGDQWVCEAGERHAPLEEMESVYAALVLGLRDYVAKNGFPGVLLGLSGGVDSALSAAIAVDALGSDKVRCVMMPSPYTSRESLEDATEAAGLLGVELDEISIGALMETFGEALGPVFGNAEPGVAEENIQARSRGLLLMTMSNKFGHMLLTTGNKSEMSVGYATLYGDMCGGYSVLKDIYKMTVFALCRWRNANRPEGALGPEGPVVPERIITKPPTAELRPDQKDEDSLPPYAELDGILENLIEKEMSVEEIVAQGHDMATVKRIWNLVDIAEYKRRQAPPGVKISHRAFGRERRYPITNGFRRAI